MLKVAMETSTTKRLQILSGSHHPSLARDVAHELGLELGQIQLERFANGEVRCKLGESARGSDVFVFQSHSKPVNDSIMEQAIIIDAAKRASARHITAICPHLGYARQDRKSSGREPITAKLVIDILTAAGADRIVSVDLHSGQIQGFFNGPFDHLTAMPVLLDYIRRLGSDIMIVSPDAGRVKASERYTRQLGVDLAIVHKTRHRDRANSVEALAIIGDVKGRRCVMIDDMIDTAGTISEAAKLLSRAGATEIYVLATHGIFSYPAVERLEEAPISKVVVTNTLPITNQFAKLEVLSLAPLIAAAVKAIYREESVSRIFAGENQI